MGTGACEASHHKKDGADGPVLGFTYNRSESFYGQYVMDIHFEELRPGGTFTESPMNLDRVRTLRQGRYQNPVAVGHRFGIPRRMNRSAKV
jgi:hypothetical protein